MYNFIYFEEIIRIDCNRDRLCSCLYPANQMDLFFLFNVSKNDERQLDFPINDKLSEVTSWSLLF